MQSVHAGIPLLGRPGRSCSLWLGREGALASSQSLPLQLVSAPTRGRRGQTPGASVHSRGARHRQESGSRARSRRWPRGDVQGKPGLCQLLCSRPGEAEGEPAQAAAGNTRSQRDGKALGTCTSGPGHVGEEAVASREVRSQRLSTPAEPPLSPGTGGWRKGRALPLASSGELPHRAGAGRSARPWLRAGGVEAALGRGMCPGAHRPLSRRSWFSFWKKVLPNS